MGPPGGGRNDITGRLTRHLNVIGIESFDDLTMNKIFTSITDWHFSKGFDSSFSRLGKVGGNCVLVFVMRMHTHKQTSKHTNIQAYKQANKHTSKQTNTQTNKHTNKQTHD